MEIIMQKIEISSKTIIFTVCLLLLLQVLWITRELIYALFLAFIFMSALRPLVEFLSHKKIPRSIAIIIVFVFVLSIVSILVSVVFPPLVQETFSFFKNMPGYSVKAFPYLSTVINVNSLSNYLPSLGQNLIQVITNLFSNILFIVSVLFFTFYFLLDEKLLTNLIDKIVDEKRSKEICEIIAKVQIRMGAWVWGQVILMAVIGVMSYIGLSVLGIKYALPLAIISGLLEALPMVGPIFSAIPAFIVGASASWLTGLSVLALYFIIQQLENNVIVPIVMKKAVGINPLLTLIALTIGGKLGGITGAFLSVPVALLLEILVSEYLKEKK
jgi:predicted PurR-regulated permease PerM